MRRIPALCLAVILAATLLAACPAAALTFAVIEPGQPGSPAEAQPVMDTLAGYLSAKLGTPVTARYANDLEGAAALLATHPDCGIVALGYFMEQAASAGMTAIAATRPGGAVRDTWRLLVPAGGPTDAANVTGAVAGTMLYNAKAAACLLFGKPAGALPFSLAGTNNPLRALRGLVTGKQAGVVLDRPQFEAAKALPVLGQCQVIAEREVPTSPVVRFGAATPETDKFVAVLTAMASDPDAANLLALLQTDGFGPADPEIASLTMEPGSEGCPR